MFVKEVLGSELREGDIILRNGKPFTIRRLERASSAVFVFDDGLRDDYCWDDSKFFLIHRPDPENRSMEDWYQTIGSRIADVHMVRQYSPEDLTMLREKFTRLRQILEEYELSQPLIEDEESLAIRSVEPASPPERGREKGVDGGW